MSEPIVDVTRYRTLAALMLLALLSQFVQEAGFLQLALGRDWFSEGQWWQPFTGHWVHGNATHLLLNLLALALISELFAEQMPGLSLARLMLALTVGVGLVLPFVLQTHWYVGLSGVLHGLFVVGACRVARRRRGFALALLAALALKLVVEHGVATGLPVRWIDMPIATESHAMGAAVGAVLALLGQIQRVVQSATVQ